MIQVIQVIQGVPPGPLLGRLKNGFDVNLPDGSTVKADDVRGQAQPGSVFVFLDIPDESYLPALKNCEAFKPHQKGAVKEDERAVVIVHFCDEVMMENVEYKAWMDEFSPSTKHLFVNERNEFTGFFASHRIQRQLNELNDDVFPMLKEVHPYVNTRNEMNDENPAKKFKDFPELGILSAFHIRPNKGFDRNLEPYSNPEKVMEDTLDQPELKELIVTFKKEAKKLVEQRGKEERAGKFPRVVTFGTGSCIPNKTRNVSANLVHINDKSCALLDCGEGTLGQIIRFYGRDGADEVLKNMRMIFISHLHADHHLGLINILSRRRKVTDEMVLLLAPLQITAWLAFYNYRIEEIFSTFDLFPCADLVSFYRFIKPRPLVQPLEK
jgi:ribonuclease Z